MGWLKGSVTFRRFRIDGPKPRLFDDSHLDRLREHAAGSQKVESASALQLGWAGASHIQDSEFESLKNIFPDHLLWDLWVESNRIPTDLLKAHYERVLKELAKDNPSGFASVRQKREAREIARDTLEQQQKDGRFKKVKLVPSLWDAGRNEIFLGSASDNQAMRFARLFGETFGGDLFREGQVDRLAPITAGTLAVRIDERAKHERLSEFVKGVTRQDVAWCPLEDRPDFLGNEFLLWLWFLADNETDTITTPDGSEVVFMFSGGVRFECPAGLTGNDTINHASGVRTPEARAAVAIGKLPRKAALTVVRHDEQFSFKLDAEMLTVSAAKLPPIDGAAKGRAHDEERLNHVRSLAEIIEQLFAAFLEKRLSAYWADDLARMQKWIGRGAGAKA